MIAKSCCAIKNEDSMSQRPNKNICIFHNQLLSSFFLLLITSMAIAGLPAFPGAEGGGAESIGGRNGRIIKVTNLNASGAGSFKAACEAEGPRIVVFRVAGIIDMAGASIYITSPYITIAGQTAPGGGILLKQWLCYVFLKLKITC